MNYTLYQGNCLDILPTLEAGTVDAVITDPPYELGFMGKAWDASGIAYNVNVWRECLRVLKPGGHLLAFGGSRTYHRLACAVEDAGFEIRDQIQWIYGSGFPKSLDVGKAIDKAAGAEREVVGRKLVGYDGSTRNPNNHKTPKFNGRDYNNGDEYEQNSWASPITAPATPEAERWQGWGTALKPAHEPIVVARKPLSEGTVAANVLEWGTGAINVDGCRVGIAEGDKVYGGTYMSSSNGNAFGKVPKHYDGGTTSTAGRWPANVILSYSEDSFIIRRDITPKQLLELAEWMNEDAK